MMKYCGDANLIKIFLSRISLLHAGLFPIANLLNYGAGRTGVECRQGGPQPAQG
jgi:hypothetical protein